MSGRSILAAIVVFAAGIAFAPMETAHGEAKKLPAPRPLAAPRASDYHYQFNGSGFFVDHAGHFITAKHVVESCSQQLWVVKNGHPERATVVKLSNEMDLALLDVPQGIPLPAIFAAANEIRGSDAIYSSSYEALQNLAPDSISFANGLTADDDSIKSNATVFHISSSATFGASGSAVMNSNGLVIGLIIQKVMPTDLQFGRISIPKSVVAIKTAAIKQFLDGAQINYETDSQPQLSPLQDRSHRQATFSGGVLCLP